MRIYLKALLVNAKMYAWMTDLMHTLLLLLKLVGRLRESDVHPISPKTPSPQYLPIDRKKEKGKIS